MKEKSQSKLAVRTRKWITESLISLMKEKDYKDISISEIVENADVSRQSFYRHYDTKEEVIDDYFYENIVGEFKSTFDSAQINSTYDLLFFYFNFWHQNIVVLDTLVKSKYNMQIFEEYDYLLRIHLSESLEILLKSMKITDKNQFEIAKSFIIGGLYNIKIQWTKDNYKQSPQELAKIVEKLLIKE